LLLREVRTKASVLLLRQLLDAIERYGAPKVLRTDNEACFTSRRMRFSLALLGIRLRPSAPFAPWQNGRIERLFGTFKERWQAANLCVGEGAQLQRQLDGFRLWYNHARPHQHLGGRTPAMAWAGVDRPRGRARLFTAWGGRLAGYYLKL
jgi:transposase InsO family protein